MAEQVTGEFGCQDSRAGTSKMPNAPSFARTPDAIRNDLVTRTSVGTATITASSLRDSLREFARQFDTGRRIAARLEAGELVRQHLARFARPAAPRPAWMPQPAMLGLPIVHSDDLGPDEWRLIDTDGEVMGEGRLEGEAP